MGENETTIDSFLRAVARTPEVDVDGATDDYVDRVEIARGGMGRIVAARDRRLDRTVALKLLRSQSPALRARFERETRLTARLQHPSIVSVHEAGRSSAGEPFYAMELVPGQPLDRVVAAATALDQRLALVPHVLAVADALAYAHRERVIHRDLKPQNILVGEFGETVVIDWGLAKELGVDEPAVGAEEASGDAIETHAGDVMGTPAYMPPEQAAGEPVDERADVYAIGALLYHVLTGTAPYSGSTSADVLAAVKREPPPPLATREPGVAPDLRAIVARAMARDPEARYPTARELAADLRRFQAGQLVGAHRYSSAQLIGRWLRRHRSAVGVAAVAALVLVTGGAVSVQRLVRSQQGAERARRQAETHRADAEELMDFMLVDLRDKLKPVGKLSLLDAIATKARDYYDCRAGSGDPADRRRQALARQNLGDVLRERGDAPGALVEYRAALALREANAAGTLELVTSHQRIGDALVKPGDAAEALSERRTALALAEVLAAQEPGSGQAQRALASGHEQLGAILGLHGDSEGALRELRTALAISARLADAAPADLAAQHDLAHGHEVLGQRLALHGDVTAAVAEFRADLAIAERLAAVDPGNATRQRDLASAHAHLGEALAGPVEVTAAIAELRAALAIDELLVAQDPTNAIWQVDLTHVHDALGKALATKGDTLGGLAEARAEVAVIEGLLARDPTSADYQFDLAVVHQQIGDTLVDRHELPAALAEYRTMLGIAETLAAHAPGNQEAQIAVAVAHNEIARALSRQQDPAALGEYRAALAGYQRLVDADPGNASVTLKRVMAHGDLGSELESQTPPDLAGALAEFRTMIDLTTEVVARDPHDALAQHELALAHLFTAQVVEKQGDHATALAEERAFLARAEQLAAADPASGFGQQTLMLVHQMIGDTLMAQHDAVAAAGEYRTAQGMARAMLAGDDSNQAVLQFVGDITAALARALDAGHDATGARAAFGEALQIAERLLAAQPGAADFRASVAAIRKGPRRLLP